MRNFKNVAKEIVELFDDLLEEKGVVIPDEDRHEDENAASIYGESYYVLTAGVDAILQKRFGKATSIAHMAYELYKQDWLSSHTTPEDRLNEFRSYFSYVMECECVGDSDYEDFDDWRWCSDISTSYVCFDEFLGAEYLDASYIEPLLSDPMLIVAYRADLRARNEEEESAYGRL